MLSAVPWPTVRRRCSVRSVATAAKPNVSLDHYSTNPHLTSYQPESHSAPDLPRPDRAAALARSKWAPKPKPSDEPLAGPSTRAPVSGRFAAPSAFNSEARASPWAATSSQPALTPGQTWAARLSATSKWARPMPPAARPPEVSIEPSASESSAELLPKDNLNANVAPTNAKAASTNADAAPKSSSRTRWPSLASEPSVANSISRSRDSEDDHARAGSRWAARSESLNSLPIDTRSLGAPQGTLPNPRGSTKDWALPQASQALALPPHLKWKPPDTAASPRPAPSPSPSASTAPLHNVMNRILPDSEHSLPLRLQRDNPPHLSHSPSQSGRLQTPPSDPRLQRDIAPHRDPTLSRNTQTSFARPLPSHRPLQSTQDERSPRFVREPRAVPSHDHPSTRAATPPEFAATEKSSRPKDAFKEQKRITEDVYIPSTVSVGHLARLLSVRLEDLQNKMFHADMGAQSSFDYVLTSDYAVLLAEEFGRKPIVNDEAAFDLYPPPPHPNSDTLPPRPPVVTIMGHVDHGKTTLLDTLRSASVAKGEVGGITQHIGAFSVPVPSAGGVAGPQSITFLDTPGHAAFSAMRARGAQVTDIIVLVVAADDGIMPQTREVIELIKKDREKIGVVVAINKIDKPGCDVDALQKALLVEDIHVEELGGDIPSVEVSGLTGKGLPELVETLSLIAEIQDVRAEPEGTVFGYVLESKVVKGLGAIATVLVLRGCLKPGSHILSGVHHAKVRIMQDSNGQTVKTAPPGMAVMVSGWKSLPNAGDEVLQGTESEIKRAIANRQRKADIEASLLDIEAINANRQQERERRQAELEAETAGEEAEVKSKDETPTGPKEMRLLIKADVSGSAEAVEGALQGIGNHLAITKVISSGVGDILESDIMMAKAVGGESFSCTIVGFSVSSTRAVDTLAAQHSVPIITSDIIYRLMEEVKARIIKLLPVIIESKVIGEAKVLQLFEIQLKGKQTKKVAGSRVINGLIEKNKLARVVRDGTVIYEGTFETMRHFKKDVTEIRKGNECGLGLANFEELQADDIIQTYETIEKPGVL
ncbi:hypothetical protein DFH09DRAFT_1387545 [Mycena vulgaris]|nr:hypothetical protein DFH09DRAFT_1387545 [Mycena vulgaris]